MSSIRNITASTAVPDDLAKRLGPSGVNEILLTLWQGYHLVQHFDALELWEDIGYKKDKGSLAFGKKVTLSRRPDATPNYFYELLNPQDVIKTMRFEDVDTQYDFIAKQIKKNITEDELDPDDILGFDIFDKAVICL